MKHSFFYKLSFFATSLAFLVILLGSYVRLSDAGLGCPDWPGCYGHLVVSQESSSIFDAHKAWKEMTHRYLAGSLAVSILILFILSLRRGARPYAPTILLFLVIFQALLGMWTVTLKLHPLVVMGHLMGGYTTFILLAWQTLSVRQHERLLRGDLRLRLKAPQRGNLPSSFGKFVFLGFFLLILQIVLGAWLSANYASLACPDFPTCQGKWWPEFHFSQAFTFWHEFGPNYEWGILNNTARVTIHMMHRLGAALVLGYWLILSLFILLKPFHADLKKAAFGILCLLFLQVSLGISNVLFHLPLGVAVAHTGVGALLLFSVLNLSVPKSFA